MRMIEKPDFEDDVEYDAFYEGKAYVDYKPWDVLESVDDMLEKFGLEIVYYGDDPETYFEILPRVLPAS